MSRTISPVTTGATLLADSLADLGVRDVLGIPGTIDLPFYDALYGRDDLRPVLVRQEQAAGFAASAFAKVSGRPAVCFVVPGPGATNLVTGVADAFGDSVPLIAITVQVPAERRNRHAIHDLDIDALYRPIVKQQFRITRAEEVSSVVRQAYATSIGGRPGPVQVLLPADVLTQSASSVGDREAAAPTAARPQADSGAIARAARLLAGARSPILYVGGGAIGARDLVLELAERLDAPVLTSFCGRGVVPEDHPRSVGPLSFPGAGDVIAAADACLAVGTVFSEYSTFGWRYHLPERLVRVDVDADELERSYPAQIGLVGDAGATLDALAESVPGRSDRSPIWPAVEAARAARRKAAESAAALDPGWPIHPAWVTQAIREVCPPETIFTTDASATQSWLFEPFFPIQQPRRLLLSDVVQTMGYALPAAMGARLADPEAPIVAITGDGSLMMTLAELSTAVTAGLPVVVVVYNDGVYNALRLAQERRYGGRFIAVETAQLDFGRLANELGAEGIRIERASELQPALRQAIAARRVTVLDVPIDSTQRSERWR